MAKKAAPAVEKIKEEDVVIKALAFQSLDASAKKAAADAGAIKLQLKDYVEDNGIKTVKGHLIVEKSHAGNKITLTNESRVTTSLKPEALDIIKKTRFGKQIIETYEGVNLEKIEMLHEKGKLSDEFINSIFDTSTTYAFKVKVEKDTNE